jgi:hypothetical protein
MRPKPQTPRSGDLFLFPLSEHLKPKYELVLHGDAMDWSGIERSFSAHFASTTSRPALAPRLWPGCRICSAPQTFETRAPSTPGSRTRSGSSSLVRPICAQ